MLKEADEGGEVVTSRILDCIRPEDGKVTVGNGASLDSHKQLAYISLVTANDTSH